MELGADQPLPERTTSPKAGLTSAGAYVFQPAAPAQLPYAVQLRLTPELKALLQQAQAEGTHVSMRFRHEPYRDVRKDLGLWGLFSMVGCRVFSTDPAPEPSPPTPHHASPHSS
jgi:hypothetical protein